MLVANHITIPVVLVANRITISVVFVAYHITSPGMIVTNHIVSLLKTRSKHINGLKELIYYDKKIMCHNKQRSFEPFICFGSCFRTIAVRIFSTENTFCQMS